MAVSGGAALRRKLTAMASATRAPLEVHVGFLEGATYPDGTSVPLVAALNEFGRPSVGQPARPFFRRMIAKHKGEWGAQIGRIMATNNYNERQALTAMGQIIEGELRQSIVDLVDPPLSPKTVARKGFAKPLIDTGHMLNSVSSEVTESET